MLGDCSFRRSESDLTPKHYVSSHWVNSYVRGDGTVVSGYWRGAHLAKNPRSSSHLGLSYEFEKFMDYLSYIGIGIGTLLVLHEIKRN